MKQNDQAGSSRKAPRFLLALPFLIVLAVILMCWINITIKDGMTGLMVLSGSFFDGCFSIIPIMLCSYLNNKYWEHNNQT